MWILWIWILYGYYGYGYYVKYPCGYSVDVWFYPFVQGLTVLTRIYTQLPMLIHEFYLSAIFHFMKNVFASGNLYKINEIMKYLNSPWSHIESDTAE